jgi:hypothetical protein
MYNHDRCSYIYPDDGTGKLEIWRVEKLELVPWPQARYGEFYSGDSFVMLYTYKHNDKENRLIYFWQGLTSTQVIIDAHYLAQQTYPYRLFRCRSLVPWVT